MFMPDLHLTTSASIHSGGEFASPFRPITALQFPSRRIELLTMGPTERDEKTTTVSLPKATLEALQGFCLKYMVVTGPDYNAFTLGSWIANNKDLSTKKVKEWAEGVVASNREVDTQTVALRAGQCAVVAAHRRVGEAVNSPMYNPMTAIIGIDARRVLYVTGANGDLAINSYPNVLAGAQNAILRDPKVFVA